MILSLVVLGMGLADIAPANGADKCLTGTPSAIADDLAQIDAARQAIQAACPGPAYVGPGRANDRRAYTKCVKDAAKRESDAGRVRAECFKLVVSDESDAVYGYERDLQPAICLQKTTRRVKCSIVFTAPGEPTRCESTATVSKHLCVGATRCIDAGDSNLNGFIDAGDSGLCPAPSPSSCQTSEDCNADGACPGDSPQGCTCSLTSQGTVCVPKCTSGADCCSVAGGTASAPTNLEAIVNPPGTCTTFVLADGHYGQTTITRSGITVRAASPCSAQLAPELRVAAANVTIDGVAISGGGISIYNPGVHVSNSCIQGFGKKGYGNGVWIFQEALDPNNRIIIDNNRLDDWGGALYAGGIAIGKADDNYGTPTEISVEVRNNRITRGPTRGAIYNAAVQSFHPFLAYKNFIDTVSGTAFQNKTFNSRVACNEVVHNLFDGALYNRLASNNVWEYNLVHDSDVGIDHFMGDGTVFRGNVIYNVEHLGRVKDQGIGSTTVTIEDNTFYDSTGWAGFLWDVSSGGTISNVLFRRNIFHTIDGFSIHTTPQIDPLWDEHDNVFFAAAPPTGTTGAMTGSSLILDPKLANPPSDFTVQEAAAAGSGAPWPLPCP